MKKIATIFEKDVYPERVVSEGIEYSDRETGKAIVLNDENKIALVGNEQNHFLQLPGGGIDAGEDIKSGIIRECLEETGFTAKIIGEVGCIDDYRSRDKKHCINYCYTVEVDGAKSDTKHTEDEANIGMYAKWVTIEEALGIFRRQKKELDDGKVTFYNTGFNIVRDILFLEEALATNKIHE